MGVTIDPSYAFPLPIFGINYLDFDFGGPDSQFALLFAGVLAAGNIQRPKLGSTPFDASVDFFGIAVPSSDRLYDASVEHEGERVLTWPLSTGLNVGWQYTPFQKADGAVSVPLRRLRARHDDERRLHGSVEHGDQRARSVVGVPARRIQPAVERRAVSPGHVGRVGRACPGRDAARTAPDSGLREVQRQPLARFLLQRVPQDSSERRLVRRERPRSVLQVPVRALRRHAHPRRAGVRRPLQRPGDGARLLLAEHLRAVSARPLSRAGVGARPLRSTAAGSRSPGSAWRSTSRAPKNTMLRADFGRSLLPERYRTVGSYNLQILVLKPLRVTVLRADLHVHTWYSRTTATSPSSARAIAIPTPEAVYAVAKARGMDLVAITDHDTIDGALALVERMPDARDIIVGEEVSCWLPDGGIEVHLGVYGMTESLHRELQPLRRNVFDVVARLREASVFFALNHLLHFYEARVPLDAYLRLLDVVPALEVSNGTMLPAHNRLSEQIAAGVGHRRAARLAAVGGQRRAHAAARRHDLDRGARAATATSSCRAYAAGLGRPGGREGGALAISGGCLRRHRAATSPASSGLGQPDHQRLASRRLSRVRRRVAAVSVPAAGHHVAGQVARTRGRCARSPSWMTASLRVARRRDVRESQCRSNR